MSYIGIAGVDDDLLEVLGYYLLAEDDSFKLYRDIYGDDHIVDKADPRIFLHDINDAMIIGRKTGIQVIIKVSPKKTN